MKNRGNTRAILQNEGKVLQFEAVRDLNRVLTGSGPFILSLFPDD